MTTLDFPRFTTPALCAESPNPDNWFPPSGGEGVLIGKQAKAVCQRCPSLDACRSYALTDPSLSGVWGGMAEKERTALRKGTPVVRRQRADCANGHPYTADNTRMTARGRRCRKCHNAHSGEGRVAS